MRQTLFFFNSKLDDVMVRLHVSMRRQSTSEFIYLEM